MLKPIAKLTLSLVKPGHQLLTSGPDFFFSVLREKEYIQVHTQLVNGRQLFPFGGENIVFISVSNTNIPINMFIVLLLISAKLVFIGIIRV